MDISFDWFNWSVLGTALDYILRLGVFAAVISAIIVAVREKRSRDRQRRSEVAKAFLQASVKVLDLRLRPVASLSESSDAELTFAMAMLRSEASGPKYAALVDYFEEKIRSIKFDQPSPSMEKVVGEITPVVVQWVSSPRKARRVCELS